MANSKTAAAGSASSTVLGLLTERLAALTIEQFVAPGESAKFADKDTIVGSLNDHQRRFYTVLGELHREHDEIVREVGRLSKQVSQAVSTGRTSLDMLEHLLNGGLDPTVVERLKILKAEHDFKCKLLHLARELFHLDVMNSYPQLADKKKLAFYSDWSVGWDEEDESLSSMLIDLVGALGAGRRGRTFDIRKFAGGLSELDLERA